MNVIKYILAALLFIVFLEVLGFAFSELYFNNVSKDYYKYYFFIYTLIELLVVFLFVILIRKKEIIKSFSFSKKYSIVAISLGFAYVFIQTPLNFIYNYIFNKNEFINYDFIMTDITLLQFFSVVVFVPIAEELYFREIIQKGLDKLNKPALSILLSSFLFAFIHLQFAALIYPELEMSLNANTSYIALFGGLTSALIYHKSKSLIPSILFHISWNLAVIIV